MQVAQDTIIYGTTGSEKEQLVEDYLKRISPSSLKYERKLIYDGPKTQVLIRVSDVHYSVDLSLLKCGGLLAWHNVIDLIRGSIAARGKRMGLVLCYAAEECSTDILQAISHCLGRVFGRTVRVFFWLITSSISCLPQRIVSNCRMHRISASTTTSPSWKEVSSKHMASLIFAEIRKADGLMISELRECLYCNEIVLLTIHDIVWPLLRMVISQRATDGKPVAIPELCCLAKVCLSCCQGYENSYRPIFHLERLAMELSKALDDS